MPAPRPHSKRFKSEFWGWSQSVTSLKTPHIFLMCSQSWELLGQRPCQDDRLRLEVESEMEGGPLFKAPLCWNKVQVSLWIDENSRQKGLVRNQVHLCGTVPVSVQSCAWVHVSFARAGLVRIELR